MGIITQSDSPGWSLWIWMTACCWRRRWRRDSMERPSSAGDACPSRSPGASGRDFLWATTDPAVGWQVERVFFLFSSLLHNIRHLLVKLLRTSLETSTTRLSSLFSPSLSCSKPNVSMALNQARASYGPGAISGLLSFLSGPPNLKRLH